MAEPTISKTFKDIYEAVGESVYGTRSLSAAQKVKAKQLANDGYLEFLQERAWEFLKPSASIVAFADASGVCDGAPAYADPLSTVTVTEATFHASMVGHNLVFADTENEYEITSYTSSLVVVVTGDASGEDAADTVTVASGNWGRLPDDFLHVIGSFAYEPASEVGPRRVPPGLLRELRAQDLAQSQGIIFIAIEPVALGTTGQRWNFLWHGGVSSDETFYYRYRSSPDEMTADGEYPVGGPLHGSTIEMYGLKKAEEEKGKVDGAMHKLADRRLATSIERDADTLPRNLGPNEEHSDDAAGRDWPDHRRGTITYAAFD